MNEAMAEAVAATDGLVNRGNPHKSTTHEEQYFHIEQEGTVFFRREFGVWAAAAAYRNPKDNFCRRTGRNIARRKWFGSGPHVIGGDDPKVTYEDAVEVFKMLAPAHKEIGNE